MSTTTYAYDLRGNIVKKTLGNGLVEKRTYDGRNRVSTLKNQTAGGTDIAGYTYQYDRAGNVMEVVEDYPGGKISGRTITNSYDGVHRLTQEKIVTSGGGTVTTDYEYDQGHNRTSKAISGGATTTYVIGNGSNGAGANQIVSETTSGVTTGYAYDNNGNRSTRTAGGHTDTYTYDDENRLVGLNYQTGVSGTGTYAYAYDYRTRRVTRTEPGPVTTHIVFDGGVSIEEFTSSPSSPTVEYVRGHDYGGGVGGLEYSIRGGNPHFNFYDSRGDVTTQTSSSGSVTFQTAYEAFGNQTATNGSTSDRQKASTKEEDPTGLLNEGFRYRDPSTGTFLTRDPLGFKAGPNMYTYVKQNPWTHFDPEGLDSAQIPVKPNTPPVTITSTTNSQGSTTTTAKGTATVGTAPGTTGTATGTVTAQSSPALPSPTAPATPLTPAPSGNVTVQGTGGISFQITTSLRGTVEANAKDQATTSTKTSSGVATGVPSIGGTASVQGKTGDTSSATVAVSVNQTMPSRGAPTTTVGGSASVQAGPVTVTGGAAVPINGASPPTVTGGVAYKTTSGNVNASVVVSHTPGIGGQKANDRVTGTIYFQF